jgi:hydrogenase maturation protein HypF
MTVRAAEATGIRTVGLSGGVFCNEMFSRRLVGHLEAAGMRVLQHEQIPPTDAGLSFGQAAVALALASS